MRLFKVDLVMLSLIDGELSLLLRRESVNSSRARWTLPWQELKGGESLERSSSRLAKLELGASPTWLEQIGTFSRSRDGRAESTVTTTYLALAGTRATPGKSSERTWFPVEKMPRIHPAQSESVAAVLQALREKLDRTPVAFMLLPAVFTLTELQRVYEILIGRRVHKASFRRALHAAAVVQSVDSWRSERRGRPAQLFRYAPRRRKESGPPVRFDRLTQLARKVR